MCGFSDSLCDRFQLTVQMLNTLQRVRRYCLSLLIHHETGAAAAPFQSLAFPYSNHNI